MRRLLPCRLLAAGSLLAPAVWPGVSVGAEDLRVQVDIHPNNVRRPINPYVFGADIDPKTNPPRLPRYPDKAIPDTADPGLRIARCPGTSVFRRNAPRECWLISYWQDPIGRNPQRRPAEVYAMEAFLQLCERFGIEPLVPLLRKMAPGARTAVPPANTQRPRSEVRLSTCLADTNVATNSEFAPSLLRNLGPR